MKQRLLRWLRQAKQSFPDTPAAELPARMRARDRQRKRNKVARASRKRNR